MNELEDLEILIRSRYPIVLIDTIEEAQAARMLTRATLRLSVPLFTWSVVQGLTRRGSDAPIYDSLEPAKALANIAGIDREGVYFLKDMERFLDQPAIVRLLLDLVAPFARDRRALVLSGPGIAVPDELTPFAATVRIGLPDRDGLRHLTREVLDQLAQHQDLQVALTVEQMRQLIDSLLGLTRFEAERLLHRVVVDDGRLDADDLAEVASRKRERLASGSLLELETPRVEATRLGGLEALRAWIGKRTLHLTDEARRYGLEAPRGILLLGVLGCGKSAAAAAIAADWGVPLARLEVGRLYDRYIGETEQRLERALAAAERVSPCVLLIDEIEKALASGSAAADGGLSDRVLGRLLGWLQQRQAPVFVVATCNDATTLPPELMRKGRFDEVFFVDLPSPSEREAIFTTHLRRRDRDPERFDTAALATASEGFSGAEIEAAVVAGLHAAFAGRRELDDEHLLEELRATRPLSKLRAEEIGRLRHWASGRTVPANRID